jgi:Acetyltransferase (GNAT) family
MFGGSWCRTSRAAPWSTCGQARSPTACCFWPSAAVSSPAAASRLVRRRASIFLAPRVLPEHRRRGLGTALLFALASHAEQLGNEASALVENGGSRAFAERFGFHEVNRQVEQVKTLTKGEQPSARLPAGVEVTTIAERPELLREAYPLACEGYADLATDKPVRVELEDWLRDEATLAGGSFVAFAGGEIVGYCGLIRHDDPGVAEDGLTVVRRDWRRRGLALTLKRLPGGGHVDATRQRRHAAGERAARLRVPRARGEHVRPATPAARLTPFVRRRGLGRWSVRGFLCFWKGGRRWRRSRARRGQRAIRRRGARCCSGSGTKESSSCSSGSRTSRGT